MLKIGLVKIALMVLWLITPICQAENKPCSGNKGGILKCEGEKIICHDGSISASKLDCSAIQFNIKAQNKQRVIQCFLYGWIITPQFTGFNTDNFSNCDTNTTRTITID
jgi:hypothetical protein